MNKNLPESIGVYYEENVPDTLDLAEHARYGLNHFMSSSLEELGYEIPFLIDFSCRRPPCLNIHFGQMTCQTKILEAIVFLRIMSGSTEKLEHQQKMVEMMISLIREDGLFWFPEKTDNKPWYKDEPLAMTHAQTRMMRAMIAWYQYTKDEQWKSRIDKMVNGIDQLMVVHKDDYAYIPIGGYYPEEYVRSCYTKRGWKDTTEPSDEKSGEEGSLFCHQGHTPGALSNWYRLTGNKQALRLAGELVRFYIKPKFWADWKGGEYLLTIGADHAHWTGHLHGHVNTLRAILEYAIVTNDVRLKQFVRDGYEWSRQSMLSRIGYVGDGQGCGCARLIGLATKLSYCGIGDYWEDIDLYIRNHGTEAQFTYNDIPILKNISEQKPGIFSPFDNEDDIFPPLYNTAPIAYDAVIGAFSLGINVETEVGHVSKAQSITCCSSHGNMGLFYAWDGILRHFNGVVQVNLLINRASPWMDI
ncbi:MAG: hypothetical protein Q7J78_07155, partial [Clostridiales bacterium]|nr:hypothetical protein [Clostridiales bacterium]